MAVAERHGALECVVQPLYREWTLSLQSERIVLNSVKNTKSTSDLF